ncbi:DUF397 domain-containing protein [Streptomyces sp. S6]
MSTTPDLSAARWVASSYSGNGEGNCVEWAPSVAQVSGVVPVRDSKVPNGPHLRLTPRAFAGLVALARNTDV